MKEFKVNQKYRTSDRKVVQIISRYDNIMTLDNYNKPQLETFYKVKILSKNVDILISQTNLEKHPISPYIPCVVYNNGYIGKASNKKNTKVYKIWKQMLERCYDPNDITYPYIGAMGTTVSDRWKCFEYFLYDLRFIEGYSDDMLKDNKVYILDILDKQFNIPPNKRVYYANAVTIKKFIKSDVCKYINDRKSGNTPKYPCNFNILSNALYINGPNTNISIDQYGRPVRILSNKNRLHNKPINNNIINTNINMKESDYKPLQNINNTENNNNHTKINKFESNINKEDLDFNKKDTHNKYDRLNYPPKIKEYDLVIKNGRAILNEYPNIYGMTMHNSVYNGVLNPVYKTMCTYVKK